MKYILYQSSSDENNVQFTLYSLEKNEVVWVGPSRDPSLINIAVPGWRPDSSALTAIYHDSTGYFDYYSISLDGTVSRMNSFSGAYLSSATISNKWQWYDLDGFANWSPSGRYLVSNGDPKGGIKGQPTLFIWDDQEQMLYKPCLPNEEQRIFFQEDLRWSFDGSHLLAGIVFLRTTTPVEVSPGNLGTDYFKQYYILDLDNRIVYELPDITDQDVFAQYKAGDNLFLGWVNWEIP
jgi:hypothetical protein